MKILHVVSAVDPRHGGPTRALMTLARGQTQIGDDVHVVGTYLPGSDLSAVEQMRAWGVPVSLIGPTTGGLRRHPALMPTLLPLVAAADVVHIHALWEEIQHQAQRLSEQFAVPTVWRPCGMLSDWSLSQGRIKKRIYWHWRLRHDLGRASAVHCTSESEAQDVRSRSIRTPIIIEPNALDLREFEPLPPRGAFRRELSIREDVPLVLSLGRLHTKKGLDLLLRAFAETSGEAALLIAGPDEGGSRARLTQLARDLGIEQRVYFLGPVPYEQRVALLADADVFTLPSVDENFGVAVAEAIAAALPVLVSPHVGIHEEVAAAGAGRVVELTDGAWTEALNEAMADAPWRARAGAAGRKFAFEEYRSESLARRWEKRYQALAGHRSAVPGLSDAPGVAE